MKKATYIVIAVAGVLLIAYIFWPRPPQTLLEAVRDHPEAFPREHRVVLPLSAASRLGYGERAAASDLPAADYASTSDAPCFFISPRTDNSLSELRVKYGDQRSVSANAEAKAAATSAGLSLTDSETAEMVLTGLRLESGIGWPNLNGPCPFGTATAVHQVVTSQLVADTVTLATSRASTAGGSASTAPGQSGTNLSTSGGWQATTNRDAAGRNIVLSAVFTPVTVEVSTLTHKLGSTPEIGRSWQFPAGFDGSLVINDFDAGAKRVRFQVSVPVNATQTPPPGMKVCATGRIIDLPFGERCDFWLPPGSALVSVLWDVETVDRTSQLLLQMKGYKTTFAPPPAGK